MARVLSKRRVSGTALLESLLAIGLFTLLFGGTVYFHSTYSAKTRAMRIARAQAWLATAPGVCDNQSEGRATTSADVPDMFANGVPHASLTLQASTTMSCNVRPTELQSTVDVVRSIISTIGDQF